jgi:hypothetical protein
MNFVRKRRIQPTRSLDYRKISTVIQERRSERERNRAIFRQNREEAERDVRTYRPEERLRTVDREARQLVDDAHGIPRMWDPETPQPVPWSWRENYAALLLLNVAFILWPLLTCGLNIASDFPILAAIAFPIVGLIVISISYHREIGRLTSVGLAISIAELVTFLIIVSRT